MNGSGNLTGLEIEYGPTNWPVEIAGSQKVGVTIGAM
jgi:hypothetical protein